jgi:hypothetical protein
MPNRTINLRQRLWVAHVQKLVELPFTDRIADRDEC